MTSRPRTLTPAEEMRLFGGLAVQPFVAAGMSIIGSPILLAGRPEPWPASWGHVALAMALYVGIGSVIVTALCVFPTVVWLVRRRPVPLQMALFFGLAFANLPVTLIVVLAGGARSLLSLHAFVSLIGLVGAAAFWVISIRGRDFSHDPAAV